MDNNLIEKYLTEKKLTFRALEHEMYSYIRQNDSNGRFSMYDVRIYLYGTKIRVVIELPLCVNRGECEGVGKELARINMTLPYNEAFSMDVLKGLIYFEAIGNVKCFSEQIDKLIKHYYETVDAYADTIAKVISDEYTAILRAEEKRQADETKLKSWFGCFMMSIRGFFDGSSCYNETEEDDDMEDYDSNSID